MEISLIITAFNETNILFNYADDNVSSGKDTASFNLDIR